MGERGLEPGFVKTTVLVSDQTPLHIAVDAGGPISLTVVAALLDHGANIEAMHSTGKTPLLLAIATDGYMPPNEEVVNFLLDRGADTKAVDDLGRNAVQLADARQYRINQAGNFERMPVPPQIYHPRGAYCRRYCTLRGGRDSRWGLRDKS